MAGTIEAGCPSLQPERPDLPKRLLSAISRTRADPASKASARGPWRRSFGPRSRAASVVDVERVSPRALAECVAPAAVAGVAALVGGTALPFYPTGWAPALAAVTAFAAFQVPRAGLALALAAPVHRSATTRSGWRSCTPCSPRLAGALVAGRANGASPSSPGRCSPRSACSRSCHSCCRNVGAARRAQTLAAVAVAAVVAGLRGVELPLRPGSRRPARSRGVERAVTAARVLVDALPAGLALETLALAAVAVLLPYARAVAARRSRRGDARSHAPARSGRPALPVVVAAWLTMAVWTSAGSRALDSCSRGHDSPTA